MELKRVKYEQHEEVAWITVTRQEQRNAISRRIYAELDFAFKKAEEDDSVKVVVVGGEGEHFGGGHDLGTAEMMGELDQFPRDMSPLGRVKAMDTGVYWRMHESWRNLAKPTIAMVQGYCIMGSWMLAASCDIIIAADDAKFADRSVRWGGVHHEYATHFLDLGLRRAKEHLWTGDFITANEAEKLGMVNHVVSKDNLRSATEWLANRIALNDLYALKMSKLSMNQAADILGHGAAIRASSNLWLVGGGRDRGNPSAPGGRVAWSKQQNERFDQHERDKGNRPW
ncbi:MAG: enoyl-CoA hydratase-related protein [Dehalococcoidia bacterium]